VHIARSDGTPRAVGRTGLPELLLGRGLISRDNLVVAEQHAQREHHELTESVVALGFVTESDAFESLATVADAPFLALDGITPSELAVRLVPEKLARRYLVIPLTADYGTLTYATCRPFDAAADRDLASASGRRTQLVVAARTAIHAAMDHTYPQLRDIDVPVRHLRLDRPGDHSGDVTIERRAVPLAQQRATSVDEIGRGIAADADATPTRRADRMRVLVADDEPITRMLVKLLLERDQYEVLEATNGRQAVEIAAREQPDLTLIDLNMPEMDGYEAIRRMRTDVSLATMPIIVLTGEEGPVIEHRVLELGADDYVVKPFERAVLRSRVHAAFRRLTLMAA
jgi:CheY-like chemotaxis protein